MQVEINGEKAWLSSANYHLPQKVGGVQVDCPITRGYNADSGEDSWGLEKDARLRLWPAGSSWIEPGTFVYPLKQRWFATSTQFSNEPTYVDGGDKPDRKKIYYHNDLDFGGCEGLTEVIAATDGLWKYAAPFEAESRSLAQGYESARLPWLAMLVRRTREASGAREVIHVGTSATLGDGGDSAAMVGFASEIFGETFSKLMVLSKFATTLIGRVKVASEYPRFSTRARLSSSV